ncbi:hypothetical protein M404DRAFT_1008057 [Pisolithus tinctorius Marx 270]|uniref:Uncharacterized protein n=1 Tax=Pisolithus tinctorius Marx 270 TaxID=870435 RepID=A0A0C3N0Y7_PISTI|nr:hypothetical protein M404DRAFT_1008057 [Pisolithus tinctorius Marx 270]
MMMELDRTRRFHSNQCRQLKGHRSAPARVSLLSLGSCHGKNIIVTFDFARSYCAERIQGHHSGYGHRKSSRTLHSQLKNKVRFASDYLRTVRIVDMVSGI